MGPPVKRHSDPNDVSLVRWSEWRFAGPILGAYLQGLKQRPYDDSLNMLSEYRMYANYTFHQTYATAGICPWDA